MKNKRDNKVFGVIERIYTGKQHIRKRRRSGECLKEWVQKSEGKK